MNRLRVLLSWCFLLVTLSSCCLGSGRNLFVLLPEPDGRTGKIEVSNTTGVQLLTRPNQAVRIPRKEEAPSNPFFMTELEIRDLFGPALDIQPLIPPLTLTSAEDKQIKALSESIQDINRPVPIIRVLLYFKTGSTELTEESRTLLRELLKIITARTPTGISIIGHTDRVGTREDNFKIGLKRANFIREQLGPLGQNPQIVEVFSHGEDNPLIPTKDEVPEPKNRRVEITVR